MQIPQNQLEAVESLYKRGLNLQAYNLAQSIAPLPKWEGTEAKLLAANLAYNLGASETSFKWIQKTWRKDKDHPKALLYYALDLLQYKGPLPTLLLIRKKNPDFNGDVRLNAWWHCLYAEIYASLRDFETADKWIKLAEEINPEDSWVWITRSHILNQQDLYQESLNAANKGLQIGGWRRASVLATAHAFCLLERYQDAMNLLTESTKHLESAWIIKELADLQSELGQHKEALANYEKLLDFMPMREDAMEQWLYSRLATISYLAGENNKAIRYADISSTPLNLKFKETLEQLKGTEKRVCLKTGFVRQHEMTCAPATLSNISRYWNKQSEHLEIAEEICYDGTSAHSERNWAEKNGYKVKEFKVNWENVVQLIDRGIPITLTTIHPGNGHLQAIIGYDEIRRTFLIRDPYFQKIDEFLVDELLESQKATGPRGMALVPSEFAERFDGLILKDSRQYDFLFHIEKLLGKHDRNKAIELLNGMKKEFPEHLLTWRASWALGSYDANHLQVLEAVENLRKLFPDDINLKLSYLSISQGHLKRDERLEFLKEFSKSENTHPLFWQSLANDLQLDARQHSRALNWFYKTLRSLPTNPSGYRGIADIFWSKRKFEVALELYRIASCLNDKDEQLAWSYFMAARHLEQTEKAVKFLQDRFRRFGKLSNFPAQTLFLALRNLGLNREAFELLDEALCNRPQDEDFKLFVAEEKAKFGLLEDAKWLLKETKNTSSQRSWLRASAAIAELEGELKTSLSYWQEIVKLEPLAFDAHQNIAFLLAATEGHNSAKDYLKSITAKFPHHRELHKNLLEWLRDEEPKEVLPIVKHLIEIDDQDAWSHRELARCLLREKKYEEALSEVEIAYQLDPQEPVTHFTKALILTEMNHRQEAANSYRQSLSLSIDFTFSMKNWLDLVRSREEKLKVLDFIKNELFQQTCFGDGLSSYYDLAKIYIESETLLGELKSILERRKDLWTAWSVTIFQLVDMKLLDEALQLAKKSVERFPLTAGSWYDLSLVYKTKGEYKEQIESLQRAVSINPNASFYIQKLSEALGLTDRKTEAKELLKDAIRRLPLDQYLYGFLADIEWQLNEKNEAIETIKKALTLDSEYDWGWQTLKNWLRELNRSDEVEQMAWELASRKPNDVNSWITLAKVLDEEGQSERQFEAINQALKIEPFNVKALAAKVRNLLNRRLFDKALRVCQTRLQDGHEPELLRFFAAQVEWERENYELSVKMLEDLGKSAPHFYATWERLAEIYREFDSKIIDYLRVTKEMTKLAPQEFVVFGYYGEACLFNQKREDAKKAFRQALALAPDYEYAACILFDLHFEDNEKEQTISALQNLKQFIKTPATTLRELQVFVREGNRDEVKRLWRELCLSPDTNRKQIDKAGKTIADFRLFPTEDKFISRSIKEFLKLPDANEELGESWIETCWDNGGIKTAQETLEGILVGSNAWRKAVRTHIKILFERSQKAEVRKFIKKNIENFKADNEIWASCGYYLNCLSDYKVANEWFSDWQSRKDLQPWMLWNYSLTLRRLGRQEDARAIHLKAISLESELDDTLNSHRTMLGLESAINGDLHEAKKYLHNVNYNYLSNFDKYFYFLLSTILGLFENPVGNLQKRDQLIKEMLNESFSYNDLWSNRVSRDLFKQSINKVFTLKLTGWDKAKIKMRIWGSYFSYLLYKRVGSS